MVHCISSELFSLAKYLQETFGSYCNYETFKSRVLEVEHVSDLAAVDASLSNHMENAFSCVELN